jgi:four helix bundle protein
MKFTSFQQIPVWQESMAFAAEVHRLCEKMPLRNDFRTKDQLKAAASSISNNIAEGFEYRNNKQLVRFLFYAKGSAGEVFNQICILFEAGSINQEDHRNFSERALELGRKIGGFIKYLDENQRSRL